DIKHLAGAIEKGLKKVQEGATLVMDVRIKPEYAASPVHDR
ncbi:uncharacterized protein METZ01_LOCUS330670, partial [marine metagenome]